MQEIFEFCELCGAQLDADNCYGEEDFPLCRYHHEMIWKALAYLMQLSGNEKTPEQPSSLLDDGDNTHGPRILIH